MRDQVQAQMAYGDPGRLPDDEVVHQVGEDEVADVVPREVSDTCPVIVITALRISWPPMYLVHPHVVDGETEGK